MTPCKGSLCGVIQFDLVEKTGKCAYCEATFRNLIRRGDDNLAPNHEPVISDVAIGYLNMARKRKA